MTYFVTEKRKRRLCAALLLSVMMLFSACAAPSEDTLENSQETQSSQADTERVDTGFILTGPDSYDSADTALLVDKDKKESTVTFLNLELGKQ